MIKVEISQIDFKDKWNSFLESHPAAHHSHLYEWQEIFLNSFGYRSFYLVAQDADKIVGILPLTHVKSPVFGTSLISVPFLNAGGILSSSIEAESALIKYAIELGNKLGTKYLELRQQNELEDKSLSMRTHKVTMLLQLEDTEEGQFQKFPAKLRSQVRRPTKDGFTSKIGSVAEFYPVFAENMHDLGTPVYPKRFITEIKNVLKDKVRFYSVFTGDNFCAGAGLIINFKDTSEILLASTIKKYNSSSPNMLLYWEAIKSEIALGSKVFDFGRCSLDSGTHKFKAQWGSQPKTLYWYYDPNKKVPDINPKNSKFEKVVAIWQRLPLRVANILGPQIAKWLP